jgi:hypothetical protein
MSAPPARRRFTLDEAGDLLPAVRRATDEAVERCTDIVTRMENLGQDDPEYARLGSSLNDEVSRWRAEIESLGAEVKGLWLVDFDNGEGYYCWSHPEPSITHFHGYEEGFAGRMKIV